MTSITNFPHMGRWLKQLTQNKNSTKQGLEMQSVVEQHG